MKKVILRVQISSNFSSFEAGSSRCWPAANGPTRRCPRSSLTRSTAPPSKGCAGSWTPAERVPDRRGGRQSQAQFQYTLQGENLNDLNNWAPRLLQKLRSMPQLRDVNTDQDIGQNSVPHTPPLLGVYSIICKCVAGVRYDPMEAGLFPEE